MSRAPLRQEPLDVCGVWSSRQNGNRTSAPQRGGETALSPPAPLAASPGITTGAPSAPPVPVLSEGLGSAGGPACSCKALERDRREGASPGRCRCVTAWWLCNVLADGELLLLARAQAPAAVVSRESREERGLRAIPTAGKPLSGQ